MCKYIMKFVTFAAGSPVYLQQAQRLIDSAKKYEPILYSEDFLKKCEDFWPIHRDFIEKNARGYGYWLWKPYLIKHTMQFMDENDVLFYCDTDFIFRENNFNELLKDVKKCKIIGSSTGRKELTWNKMDTINRIGVEISENDIQIQAGILLISVCKETRTLVEEWYSICCENTYKYLDDTPSSKLNHSSFIEHRHDQSIFSLLLKKHNIGYQTNIMDVLRTQKLTPHNNNVRKRTRHYH